MCLVHSHLILLVIGHLLVTANFMLGVVLASVQWFAIYCGSFATIWFVTGIVFLNWGIKWRRRLVDAAHATKNDAKQDEDEEEALNAL